MSIVIENLSYTYNPKSPFERHALKNINLTVHEGEFLGIIGSTGSGKSTLIMHLNGLTKLQSGVVTVEKIDLSKKYDYKLLRSTVGMVFQYPEYQLFDETVAKDIAFGPKNLKLSAEEIEIRVREAISLVGLDYDEIATRSPFELSGGQKRRVAIAGVIAMKPKILILDEPTAGLDPKGKQEILELIMKIKRECSPTIIMISHNMDEVSQYCTSVALMSNSELVSYLPTKEMFMQKDLLLSVGLDIPMPYKIACMLRERGVNISPEVFTREELISELKKLLAGGKKEVKL